MKIRSWLSAAGLISSAWVEAVASGPPGYDEQLAVQYATLAGAAYCEKENIRAWNCSHCKALSGVTHVNTCTSTTMDATTVVVGHWNESCFISVEGTATWAGFWTDFELFESQPVLWEECQGCRVHGGFLSVWRSVRDCVFESLKAAGCPSPSSNSSSNITEQPKLRVTGHSLGSGVAEIAMLGLRNNGYTDLEMYTFGGPRAGDLWFASNLTDRFEGKLFRLTHARDPIPHTPPSLVGLDYYHAFPEIFYPGNLSTGHKECNSEEENDCSSQYYVWEGRVEDHLHYLGVHLGVTACRAGAEEPVLKLQQSQLWLKLAALQSQRALPVGSVVV